MNSALLGLGLPQGADLFWIFLAVVILFGAKKIPELARGLGKSVGEFRRAKEEFERELQNTANEPKPTLPATTAATKPETPDSTKTV